VTESVPTPLLVHRERLWPVVLVSAAAHAALVAGAVLHRPPPLVDLSQKPIVAKLVRLGEKRPQNLLPRKEEGAPPPAAAPVPIPAPPAPPAEPRPAAAAPKPAPRPPAAAPSPQSGKDVLASVLSRVKRDKAMSDPARGDPSGHALGDASEAGAGDQYLALVERTLRDTYILPATISDVDRLHLRATVLLFIDGEGRVLRHVFESRSGNAAFDAALERAIAAARLTPPA